MKKDSISDGLMKMPWDGLAGILVTKDDLRGSGWSEAKIKLHLGEPRGRHPSTHFRNPLGQPYWTGQQVLSAAVRAGYISAELKDWPYQAPVHGLRDCGSFIMAIELGGKLVMHPQVDQAMRSLGKIKASLASLAIAKPRLAELNDLAEPGLGLGQVILKHFNVRSKAFPSHLPESECVDFALWVYGEPKEFAQQVRSFADKQLLLTLGQLHLTLIELSTECVQLVVDPDLFVPHVGEDLDDVREVRELECARVQSPHIGDNVCETGGVFAEGRVNFCHCYLH